MDKTGQIPYYDHGQHWRDSKDKNKHDGKGGATKATDKKLAEGAEDRIAAKSRGFTHANGNPLVTDGCIIALRTYHNTFLTPHWVGTEQLVSSVTDVTKEQKFMVRFHED